MDKRGVSGQIQKIFGSGPLCIIAGLLFTSTMYHLGILLHIPQIQITQTTKIILFTTFMSLTLITVVWGFISLPVNKRGEELTTTGIFKYIKHPIYAGFIDFFIIGIGIYLQSWLLTLSFIPLLYICAKIVKKEETYLTKTFGKKYEAYNKKTARFIPKIY